MMWEIIQQTVNGLALGSIYGLIAIGYTMVYGIIGMINFAHGDIYMLGAYVTAISIAVISSIASMPVVLLLSLTVLIVVPITALHGYVLEKIAYKPLRHAQKLSALITAIGMSLFLQNYIQISQGARNQGIPTLISGGFTLWTDKISSLSAVMSYTQVVILVVTLVSMLTLAYVIKSTSLGRQCRSTQQDQMMSAMLGVNTDRVISVVFIIGAGLAGVGSVLVTLNYGSFDFFIGFIAGIKAFTAAVLGGIGSVTGAMLGGLLLGMSESFFSGLVNADYKDVFAFGLLIFFMVFKPTGLLGTPEVTKV
ncbi:MAG: branched-chain amino acid ABC transporter permease LivH [SAR324 cluster bacterium]|nr:branched-chain amino acid ABC transporter permease LivH [SAR324 cluster bacterium]